MKSDRIMPLAAAVLILTLVLLGLGGSAIADPQAPGTQVKATRQIKGPSAQVRTAGQMAAAAAGGRAAPATPPRPKPFLSRLDRATYKQLKTKAAVPGGRPTPDAPVSAAPQPPSTSTVSFAGVNADTAGYYPPDTHGAAGRDYFAEVTNTHLDIYQKAAPYTLILSLSTEAWLEATPGYFTSPRMIYDPVYDRWIFLVTQWRTPSDPAHQYLYLAVSLTADPTGDFYLYTLDVSDNSVSGNTHWDYPQLGHDRNAIIITGDFFDLNTGYYIDSRMFSVAKSLLYSGQAFDSPLFTGLDGTLAPPIVLDNNPYSFLAAADWYTDNNYVTLYALQGSGTSAPLLYTNYIQVPTFELPPYAVQPGTDQMLDTLDARFVNAGTQIGNSLFQVHTVEYSGLATPRFYEFDTLNNIIIQSGIFYGSATSNDFNASIAANRFKDVFVTWSSTDAPNNVNAQVRVAGRLHTDPPGVISNSSSLFGSATFLTGEPSEWDPFVQRWGDYAAVSLDPADPRGATAWIVNEYVLTGDLWGSRIGRFSLPVPNGATPAINFLLLLN
ncbi:MAG: hypothetical protein PHU44_18200 [Syntrophales bacterium]|nr:hypothetical protein [Syntrophales bacterium]MDD5640715.1 hypothetical protein [Syntrophales bacterium]